MVKNFARYMRVIGLKQKCEKIKAQNVATWFIFFAELSEEGGLSICVDANGNIIEPLLIRSLENLRNLTSKRTIVILPTQEASLHQVELPWFSERKARTILLYALEEVVTQAINQIHIAFDGNYYTNNRYLIAVVDKQNFNNYLQKLQVFNITFDAITLDIFALHLNEVFLLPTGALVNSVDFKGMLRAEWVGNYLHTHPNMSIMHFKDTNYNDVNGVSTAVNFISCEWIAKRLSHNPIFNLCQGEFQKTASNLRAWRWHYASGACILTGLILVLILKSIAWYRLQQQLQLLNQATEKVYHNFFPQGTIPKNPRLRMKKWLKEQSSHQDMVFWNLELQLAKAMIPKQMTLTTLNFVDQRLVITLSCLNFSVLEKFQLKLQKAGLSVKQLDVISQGKIVIATLELML